MYKVIIAGTREFDDYEKFKKFVTSIFDDNIFPEHDEKIQIISRNANGVDKLGERYAKEYGYDLLLYPANWDKYGKKAGPIRNTEMVKIADCLIAVWDGQSKGTKDIINKAKANNLNIYMIKYKKILKI
jgi:uncharacterized protein YozE (UPF0346 family)